MRGEMVVAEEFPGCRSKSVGRAKRKESRVGRSAAQRLLTVSRHDAQGRGTRANLRNEGLTIGVLKRYSLKRCSREPEERAMNARSAHRERLRRSRVVGAASQRTLRLARRTNRQIERCPRSSTPWRRLRLWGNGPAQDLGAAAADELLRSLEASSNNNDHQSKVDRSNRISVDSYRKFTNPTLGGRRGNSTSLTRR